MTFSFLINEDLWHVLDFASDGSTFGTFVGECRSTAIAEKSEGKPEILATQKVWGVEVGVLISGDDEGGLILADDHVVLGHATIVHANPLLGLDIPDVGSLPLLQSGGH